MMKCVFSVFRFIVRTGLSTKKVLLECNKGELFFNGTFLNWHFCCDVQLHCHTVASTNLMKLKKNCFQILQNDLKYN